jgi:hypothetical protein
MPRRSRSGDAWTRERLALVVVGASFLSIVLIAGAAIALADNRGSTARLVFTSVLPVIGTWVGTVLAFYFARENLEAATSSTLALTGREIETPVTKVMIPEADFIALDLGADQKLEDVKLTTVRAKMKEIDPPSRRVPIRDTARAVLCVIHDSTLTAYADSQEGLSIDNLGETKLGDLLADKTFEPLIKANGFVARSATVADARSVMSSIENCNDIFVTDTGKPSERAIGWLTNTLLAGVQ